MAKRNFEMSLLHKVSNNVSALYFDKVSSNTDGEAVIMLAFHFGEPNPIGLTASGRGSTPLQCILLVVFFR